MQETQIPSLCREDPLEEAMATHSSILVWRIPWTGEPGGLQSMRSRRADKTEQLTLSLSGLLLLLLLLYSRWVASDFLGTTQTGARQAPLSMGFSRQEHRNGLLCPAPEDLPDPRIESTSFVSCVGRQVLYHECHLGCKRRS